MFNFIKNLFSSIPKFGLGALKNPDDIRNVDIATVQAPVTKPDPYDTDLSAFGIDDQAQNPSCVGFSFARLCEYIIWKLTGKIVKIDGNALYAKAKKEDGIPTQSGTYPATMAKIITRDGVVDTDGNSHPVDTGYAFVAIDYEAICQAIYQNGVISAGFEINTDWFRGIIGSMLSIIGGHQVVLCGYDNTSGFQILHGVNSWGIGWIGKIAGFLNHSVAPGHFEAEFEDVKDTMMNLMSLVPVSNDILNVVQNVDYRFLQTLQLGSKNAYDVAKLQTRLGIKADGVFGPMTRDRVSAFQSAHSLAPDGVAGIMTLSILNKTAMPIIPLIAKAIQDHEGYIPSSEHYAGSHSWRNCNPGNFKVVSKTLSAYMTKLGATGVDAEYFVIFPSYDVGFKALCTFISDGCSDKLTKYSSKMTLASYIGVYAPASENDTVAYINDIVKATKVPADTQIGLLV